MKNILKTGLIAAAVCGLLAAVPLTASATGSEALYSEDGLYRYGLDEEGNVKLFDFTPETYTGEVVVPSQIDGRDVVYIGNGTFAEADGITSVTIPATVESIGTSVFMGCGSLEKFVVEEGNAYLYADEAGVLFSDEGGMLECYPPAKTETSYTVPDTVDEIAPGAFMYCAQLEEVILPESLAYIDAWAFAYTGLQTLVLPDGLIQIDDYAFAYCAELSEITFGEGLQYIYGAAFAECRALKEVDLPEGLLTVEQYAFSGTGMKSVTIPDSVTKIGYCAFGYDSSLNAISDFTVYGTANSMAQTYCSSSDEENNYQNSFDYIEIDENGDIVTANNSTEAATEASSEAPAEDPGSSSKKSGGFVLLAVLIGGGALAAVLAVVLVVLLVKKPKSGK